VDAAQARRDEQWAEDQHRHVDMACDSQHRWQYCHAAEKEIGDLGFHHDDGSSCGPASEAACNAHSSIASEIARGSFQDTRSEERG
jgi:hypothetical protein